MWGHAKREERGTGRWHIHGDTPPWHDGHEPKLARRNMWTSAWGTVATEMVTDGTLTVKFCCCVGVIWGADGAPNGIGKRLLRGRISDRLRGRSVLNASDGLQREIARAHGRARTCTGVVGCWRHISAKEANRPQLMTSSHWFHVRVGEVVSSLGPSTHLGPTVTTHMPHTERQRPAM